MGLDKAQRPILAPDGLEVTGNSTFRANVVFSTGARVVDHIQSLTGASTGTQITNYGVTYITSTGAGGAGDKVFTLAAPIAGVRKTIIGHVSSTKAIQVRTLTSAATFLGSTMNSFTFTTGSTYALKPITVDLMGYSTVTWAILGVNAPLALNTTAAVIDYNFTVAGATA